MTATGSAKALFSNADAEPALASPAALSIGPTGFGPSLKPCCVDMFMPRGKGRRI